MRIPAVKKKHHDVSWWVLWPIISYVCFGLVGSLGISALFGIPQHKGSLGISIAENPQRVNPHGFGIYDILGVFSHIFSIYVSINLDVYYIFYSSRPNGIC